MSQKRQFSKISNFLQIKRRDTACRSRIIGAACGIGLLLLIACLLWRPMPASSKGGVYESTKHGNATTGVERIFGEPTGDCTHCHDEHASRDGMPTPGGPYDYLLFKANDNNLCYTNDGAGPCHASASGSYEGPSYYGNSDHGNATERYPGGKYLPSCQACHNPHGVDNGDVVSGTPFASLLVKWAGTDDPPPNDIGEEFLCFGGPSGSGYCHSTGSSMPIEDAFAGTATAIIDSKPMNTHHDISYNDQQYSGAKIECVNCHNVHRTDYSTSGTLVPNPDGLDGDVAAGVTWAFSNFLSEWCLDCHDNSFPSTVTPPTVDLTDIYDGWMLTGGGDKADQHGPEDASNKISLRAGSGYARFEILQCTDCHVAVAHGYYDLAPNGYDQSNQNLFHLKSKIYDKLGTTPLDSDDPVDPTGDVRITDIDGTNTDPTTNGKYWCSSCHPDPMGGSKTKGCLSGNCHKHGTSSF